MTDELIILAAGALLLASVAASMVATRVRVPALVLFLGIGMLVGSDGVGWIEFSDYGLAKTVGVIALSLILFEGGLGAGLGEIRPVLAPAVSLALVGTILTAAVTGIAAVVLFDLPPAEGMLIGAILSSTDGAAIFALLRNSTLKRKLARTLEAESGLNDPVAVLLVLGLIEWVTRPDYGIVDMVGLFAQQLAVGLSCGVVAGRLAVGAFRRARLPTPGLYPVASLATAAIAFGSAGALHGSGFLAVYVAGLALGSAAIPARRTIGNFHEGLSWVAQLTLFLVLGLLVFPSQLGDVAVRGGALALVLVFIARPLASAIATLPFSFTWAERMILGWAGLRGAVPVVLGTFPVIAGVPGSLEFFNAVFFAVILSTLLQGSTFEPFARRLRLTTSVPALPAPLAESGTIRALGAEVLEYPVHTGDAVAGARIRDLGLPRDALVNVIVRDGQALPPRGSTRLLAGDRVHVLIREEAARRVHELVDRWRAGPVGPPPRVRPNRAQRRSTFSAGPWWDREGDPALPTIVRGQPVIHRLRTRRDGGGGLFVLADGRYAVTGQVTAVGGRDAVSGWVQRRMRHADDAERVWLQTVLGTLAADPHE